MQTVTVFFIGVVMVLFVCGVFQLCGRYLIVYKTTHESIKIEVFGLPVMRIPYGRIQDVRRISGLESLKPGMRTLRVGNRIVGGVVRVQKDRGAIRSVLVTPDDPDEFVATVKGRLPVPDVS
ncbi:MULTISPECIES: hypothetical protein [Pseudomonas]|uniref:hypothetical protein n=1 Tax=Pseudomonas TaxID=286 RepID=UPI001FF4B926|nr:MULTISPECIES: hypothetical protein [Pseudomonas]